LTGKQANNNKSTVEVLCKKISCLQKTVSGAGDTSAEPSQLQVGAERCCAPHHFGK